MTSTTGLTGLTASVAWQVFMKDPEKQIDKFAKNKDVQKELDYFKKTVANATSVDDLLKDKRAMKVLLSAYDLEDETNALGLIKKVLTEDPTADGALSSKLADSRFAAMAKGVRLDQGLAQLQRSTRLGTIDDKYVQSEFEQALGAQDPALREAAYFARNIASKTGSVYSVLGDKIVRDVVQNTLNIPAQIAIQPVETQARIITQRIDITKFVDDLSKAGGLNATQISTATADNTLLGNNLKISDAAIKQVTTLQTQINKIITDYDAAGSKRVDPTQTETQKQALPALIQGEQILTNGQNVLDNFKGTVGKLQKIVADIGDPANNAQIGALKQKFTDLYTNIVNTFTNTAVPPATSADGSGGVNLFRSGGDATVTTNVTADGSKQFSYHIFSNDDLSSDFTAAINAFSSVNSASDTSALAATADKLTSVINRSNGFARTIASDFSNLTAIKKDLNVSVPTDSADLAKGKRSLDDAATRSKTIADLLGQISTLATQSAARGAGADRTDLTNQFNALRTQITNTINTPLDGGLDNLLTTNGRVGYDLFADSVHSNVKLYVNGVSQPIQDIVDGLANASLSDVSSAQALADKAVQLTNRTDTVATSLAKDQPILNGTITAYDPKATIELQLVALRAQIPGIVANAAVGSANLLASTQSDISLAVTSSTSIVKLRAAKTFQSDVTAQINTVLAQFGNGTAATHSALSSLSNITERTTSYLNSDNRNLTFEQGKIGAVLDTLDPDTAADGTSKYKVNSFTEKFLSRYLILNGATSPSFNSAQSVGLTLLSNSGSAANILSLSLSV